MPERCYGQRAPLLWVLVPWMVGLTVGKVWPGVPGFWGVGGCAVAAAGVAVGTLWVERKRFWWMGLSISLLLAGFVYYTWTRGRLAEWERLPPREVQVAVEMERVFAVGKDADKVRGWGIIRQAAAPVSELVGQRVYLTVRLPRRAVRPIRTSVVEVVGRLQRLPKNPPVTTFDGYLAAMGANFTLNQGRLRRTVREPTAYRQFCEAAQERLGRILGFGLEGHPQLAGVFKAMVLGQQHELSEEQDAWFIQTGTLHLFSISGMHIAVIALAFRGVLGLLRLPAGVTFVVTLLLLWLYVDVTGRAPSAVRAFLMVFLVEVAGVLRVPRSTISALVASAALVLLLDPLQFFSASFQMSYGIVAALLFFGLPLGEAWERRWRPFRYLAPSWWRWWHHAVDTSGRWLLNAGAMGVSTALVSAVTGVLYFGLLTPGSLLANLVAIPLASLALLSGLASLASGLVGAASVSLVFNHGGALVLTVVEQGLARFAALPGVHLAATFPAPGVGFLALTGLLVWLMVGFHRSWDRRIGGFWGPLVYTAGVLIVLVSYPSVP